MVEELGDIPIIGEMNIREKGHRLGSHDIDIAQGCSGYMKSGQKRIIAQSGVHAVHGHRYVFAPRLDHTRVVQLAGVNNCFCAADDLGDLGVGIKVA